MCINVTHYWYRCKAVSDIDTYAEEVYWDNLTILVPKDLESTSISGKTIFQK